jgi:hypothetical protein
VDTKISPPPASKKKKSAGEIQRNLRDLARPDAEAPARPPLDLKKLLVRVGGGLTALWIAALFVPGWIAKAVMGVLTVLAIAAVVWVVRFARRSEVLGAILRGAETEEGRKEAIKKLETEFKKGDTQAVLARAQLEMQEDPRKALHTLESIDLGRQLGPVADQVRSMRAMIHLTQGEAQAARVLVDKLEIGKQQDVKTRAMFATVAGEAWARTGSGKKAVETLELFNPEDAEYKELRPQMWRARAFAYAAVNDNKGVGRALRKLAEMSPHLLAMFINAKRVHPLLEREAKQLVMKMGVVPRKVVRPRM